MTELDSLVDAPAVTASDSNDDRNWFVANPGRRYRLRKTNGTPWIIRRRARSVLLRARITTAIPRGLPGPTRRCGRSGSPQRGRISTRSNRTLSSSR
jgi:hypothetical protein